MTDPERIDPLCCCEYFDQNNERFHILGCCCNCLDFDQLFESIICCKPIKEENKSGMLITFQDRLRIPWRGGAKQISLDTIIPVFVIPLVIGIAAINFYCSVIMCISTPIFLGYSYYYLRRVLPRSRFFFMWTIWSVIYLLILFESTAPLLELLPEENYLLILFVCLAIFFLFKTRQKARQNFVVQSFASEDDLPDIIEEPTSVLIDNGESDENDHHPNICQICRKYAPPRTFHCSVCQACIVRRDHHSFWLDCCIGESNHRFYISGLLFSFAALLFGANLALTSVCHPFLIFKVFNIPVLLPDDCSEVYDQYEMGISFILSIYSLLIAAFILIALIMQTYLISKGLTLSEWRNGQSGNRKSFYWNWKAFICWLN